METGLSNESQLARSIYTTCMSTMKFTLDMEERRYPDKGRNDNRFRFFKKQLMKETYDNLEKLFITLEHYGILVKTDYEECLKNGYRNTPSGGSGYINSPALAEIIID